MKIKDAMMYILGALIVIGFFGSIFMLVKIAVPETNRDLMNILLGALIGAFITVVSFFYGSSKGSQDKNELLKQ